MKCNCGLENQADKIIRIHVYNIRIHVKHMYITPMIRLSWKNYHHNYCVFTYFLLRPYFYWWRNCLSKGVLYLCIIRESSHMTNGKPFKIWTLLWHQIEIYPKKQMFATCIHQRERCKACMLLPLWLFIKVEYIGKNEKDNWTSFNS